MVQPPCYDRVNHRDCPKREWCKEVGRSKCKDWVEYEEAHKIELENRHKEAERKSAEFEHHYRLMKRISHHSRHR